MPTWEYWNAHQLLVYQKSNQFFTLQFSEPCESSWVLARKAWWKKRSHYSILNHLILKVEEEKVWNPMQSKPHYFRNDPLVVSEPAQGFRWWIVSEPAQGGFRACPGWWMHVWSQRFCRLYAQALQTASMDQVISTKAALSLREGILYNFFCFLAVQNSSIGDLVTN